MLNIYETVYGLNADPFRLSPDYRFSYSHPSYARSKAYLDYALIQGEGFVMITGAPGTGKTTLVREILANIDIAQIHVATLTSTQLRTRDLLQMVATAFGLQFQDSDKATLLTALEQSLQQQHKNGRRAVLIVDEAQGLSIDALEELRLLANLQTDNQMLMQVFLLGQEKLRELINLPNMKQLRQRVVASSLLEQLNLEETVNYVEHRLDQAGWQGNPEIGGDALQLVHKYSGGVPRMINLICTRLLLSGGLRDKHAFDGQDARDVILELQKEMLIDADDTEIKVDDSLDVRSLGPSSRHAAHDEENTDTDQPNQRSPSRNSAESADGDARMQQSAAQKSSGGSSASKVSLRKAAPNRNKKKGHKGHEQKLSATAENELEAAIKGDTALPREGRAQVLPFSEGRDKKIGLSGHDSSVTKRSIAMATAMATARSAPVSGGRKPDEKLTRALPESVSHGEFVTTSPGAGDNMTTLEAGQHKGKSLGKPVIIILLAAGALTAVTGVKFRDYEIMVSAQADKNGVIRSVMSGIKQMGNDVDELDVKKSIN